MLLLCCGPKQDDVEIIIEDGVEVVLNHQAPYRLKANPSRVIFEEVNRIDTENDYIAETGLTDISEFNVDSLGNIFFFNSQNPENFYFKLDRYDDRNGVRSIPLGSRGLRGQS